MTAGGPREDRPHLREVGARPGPGGWRWVGLTIAIGVGEVLAAYVMLGRSVRGSVVTHYGLSGTPNGSMSLPQFLAAGLIVELTFGAILLAFVAAMDRSPVAARYVGRRGRAVLASFAGLLLALALPAIWITELYTAAAGPTGVSAYLLGLVVGLAAPAILLTVAAIVFRRNLSPPDNASDEASGTSPPSTSTYYLQCSACGQRFGLASLSILTPHLPATEAAGAQSLLYTRCVLCGEQGWNLYFGKGRWSTSIAVS